MTKECPLCKLDKYTIDFGKRSIGFQNLDRLIQYLGKAYSTDVLVVTNRTNMCLDFISFNNERGLQQIKEFVNGYVHSN